MIVKHCHRKSIGIYLGKGLVLWLACLAGLCSTIDIAHAIGPEKISNGHKPFSLQHGQSAANRELIRRKLLAKEQPQSVLLHDKLFESRQPLIFPPDYSNHFFNDDIPIYPIDFDR